MIDLINFPGKNEHFSIPEQVGDEFYSVGIVLLKDKRGAIVSSIVVEHRGSAKLINLDILSHWVQGKGISDCTWRGLLGALRVPCPGLAHDIEEALRPEEGFRSTYPLKMPSADDTVYTTPTAAEMPGHTSTQPQYHYSEKLRAGYAKYPHPNFSNPQCHKWIPCIRKKCKYIHPYIADKEDQKEQLDEGKKSSPESKVSSHCQIG